MPPRYIDITGQRFGRLIALERVVEGQYRRWRCVCDCGREKLVNPSNLKSGMTQSCGCYRDQRIRETCMIHGASRFPSGGKRKPEYAIWRAMRQRCANPKDSNFRKYGGRGITVCERWTKGEDGLHPYLCFLNDMGPRPSTFHSIERLNNSEGYSPSNCVWATAQRQAMNRRCTFYVLWQGSQVPLGDLCRKLNLSFTLVYGRIKRGWSVDKALATPAMSKGTWPPKGSSLKTQAS